MRPETIFPAVGRIFGDGQTKLSFLSASGKVTSRHRPHGGSAPGWPGASRNDISSRRTHDLHNETQFVLHFVTQIAIMILNGEIVMQFEWDEEKEKTNIDKHGIDFSTAALVFGDNNRIEKYDEKHSAEEDRYITIGQINGVAIVVMVVYTSRNSAIRIISARLATKRETEAYYNAKEY